MTWTQHSRNPWYQEFTRTERGLKPVRVEGPCAEDESIFDIAFLSQAVLVSGVLSVKRPGSRLDLLHGEPVKGECFPYRKVVTSEVKRRVVGGGMRQWYETGFCTTHQS